MQFVAVLLTLLLPVSGGKPEWTTLPNGRYARVEVAGTKEAHFTMLDAAVTSVAFTNVLSDAAAAENQIRMNGSGVALGDVDGDGWCDIYLCSLTGDNVLFRNLGAGRFTNVTTAAGVACANEFSSGAVLADVDGDRDLDLLVGSLGAGVRLFANDGGGRFQEATNAGIYRRFTATTITLADVEGDGDLDLYVANYKTTTIRSTGFSLLNIGGRKQIRMEDRNSLELTPAGRVLEHGEPDILYLCAKPGQYDSVPWNSGRFIDEQGSPLRDAPRDWGLTAMFRDLNGDGAPDLYVCNDFHSVDRIWMNDGTGRFKAAPQEMLRHTSTFSMCVDMADINRDGFDDLFVADMLSRKHPRRVMQQSAGDPYTSIAGHILDRPQFDRNTLQVNRGDGTYAEIAEFAGVEASEWTWAALFLDLDLDGYDDLFCATGHMFDTQDLDAAARIAAQGPWPQERIAQKLLQHARLLEKKMAFRNMGDLTFQDRSDAWGFNQAGVSHGMALADLDNDGDLDLVSNNLNAPAAVYRNDGASPRIAVRLRGKSANTRGVGARITVSAKNLPEQSQEMIAGGRYLSGDEYCRVFAAGASGENVRVKVRWRSGSITQISDVPPNSLLEVFEP